MSKIYNPKMSRRESLKRIGTMATVVMVGGVPLSPANTGTWAGAAMWTELAGRRRRPRPRPRPRLTQAPPPARADSDDASAELLRNHSSAS